MNAKQFRRCSSAGCTNGLKGGATRYCSRKCSALAQKKPRSQCLSGCGTIANWHRSNYCSISCAHGHRYRCRAEAFLTEGGTRGYVSPHFLARFLRDYYGERCLRCGWSKRHPNTGNVPVEVEHIDGNWENNRLTNLTLLCPNCHALTPTFRGLNRGRGRAYRLNAREVPADDRVLEPPLPIRSAQKVFTPPSRQLGLFLPT
jgi:hypothetical protein